MFSYKVVYEFPHFFQLLFYRIIKDEIDLILEELELEKLSRAILNHSYQQSGSGNLLQTDVKRVYNSPQNHPDWKGQSSNTRWVAET